MLIVMDQMKEKTGMPYRAVCEAVRLPYPSFVRWRVRQKKDTPLVRQPGPQKVKPPDLGRINRDIAELSRGQDRTQGTGALYTRHGSSISRRELTSMVALARHDLNAAHRQNLRRIHWNVPNVAWSMDPCEYRQQEEAKVYLNQMQDLASRYKFAPMTGEIPCGEEIAGHLAATFKRCGPPLFLKRDNGGNLNHAAVDDVLAEHFVLPVNSPVNYPPYNGAIEKAQAELKNGLSAKLAYKPCPRKQLEAYAGTVEHDLNHQPRPCLNGRNSCQSYFADRRTFTRWERRDAYVWIANLQKDMLCCGGMQPETAWRIAAQAWLQMKGYITVSINGKVSPYFC
ncbi:MAG: transposase family protein [Nitrospirae bacterium]|nr:transposase family protein [Nitrospirota bacterium]